MLSAGFLVVSVTSTVAKQPELTVFITSKPVDTHDFINNRKLTEVIVGVGVSPGHCGGVPCLFFPSFSYYYYFICFDRRITSSLFTA